jgi:hypothetical protein
MKHMVVVLTEPTNGREEEFNEYYEDLHIDEVLATTGWKSGQRFKLTDQIGAKCPLPYLAIYEAHGDDPKQVIQTLNESRPERKQSTAINKKTAAVWIFSETGPVHEAE